MGSNNASSEQSRPTADGEAPAVNEDSMMRVLLYGDDAELPAFLTPEEAATRMRVSRWAVYDSVRAGTMPANRVGRTIRIPRAAVTGGSQAEPDGGTDEAVGAGDPGS